MTNETLTPKKFIQVFINGDEKNLPKENGQYWTKAKRDFKHVISLSWFATTNNPDNIMLQWWLNDVEWYLTPIEQPSGIIAESGRKYRSIPDDMDVETWDAMTVRERLIYKGILKPSEADINTPFFGNSGAVIPDTRKVIEPTKTAEEIRQKIKQIIIGNIGISETVPLQVLTGLNDATDIIADFFEEYRNQGVQLPSEEKCDRCGTNPVLYRTDLCASCYQDVYGIDESDLNR